MKGKDKTDAAILQQQSRTLLKTGPDLSEGNRFGNAGRILQSLSAAHHFYIIGNALRIATHLRQIFPDIFRRQIVRCQAFFHQAHRTFQHGHRISQIM